MPEQTTGGPTTQRPELTVSLTESLSPRQQLLLPLLPARPAYLPLLGTKCFPVLGMQCFPLLGMQKQFSTLMRPRSGDLAQLDALPMAVDGDEGPPGGCC